MIKVVKLPSGDRWVRVATPVATVDYLHHRGQIWLLSVGDPQVDAIQPPARRQFIVRQVGPRWEPVPGDPAMRQRRATGEMCSCGRPAVKVFRNPDGTQVPYCGIPG